MGYEEYFVYGILSDYFKDEGFEVMKYYILLIVFWVVFGNKNVGLIVVVFCEYDVFFGIGYGCGYNLIVIVGVVVVLGLKIVIERGLKVRVVVMGILVEEGGGGKIEMIYSGCFEDVDFCVMLYLVFFNVVYYVS